MSMNADELLDQLRERCDEVFPSVTAADLAKAEKKLGFRLTELHRRIYREIGNGGRSLLEGLYGIPAATGGYFDDGCSLIEWRDRLIDDQFTALVPHVVPIVDLGCAQWIAIDCDADRVLTIIEAKYYDLGFDLAALIQRWLSGEMSEALFAPGPSRWGKNPFTGDKVEFKSQKPRGKKIFTSRFSE
jgi:hypothetical protein